MNRALVLSLVTILACSWSAVVSAGSLHEAARRGDLSEVAQLVDAGADVNAFDHAGLTPLNVAALAGRRAIVVLLLKLGANPRGHDGKGFTALHAAVYGGHREVVVVLIEAGADVNDQRNRAETTALHVAAERNFQHIARTLIAHGASLDAKERNGWTPVMRSTFKQFPQMVKLLRDHGSKCSDGAGPAFHDYCMKAGT